MKKLLLIFFLAVISYGPLVGQKKNFDLYYITKDYTTQVGPLCEWLKERYELGRRDKNQCNIFYVPNSESPIVIYQNVGNDNSNDFERVLEALITKSETKINPQTDVTKLLDIFAENDLVKRDGQKIYERCNFSFMITPTFWNLQYNEKIFASFYVALELDSAWAKDYVGIDIYHSNDDGLEPDSNAPFGALFKFENYKFQLLTY